MNEVNRTLYIPLCGKSRVSREHIILKDPSAERIWAAEGFPLRGKAKSKWLAYNMAMRARVFDEWTEAVLLKEPDAVALHVGCGLDSRFERVKAPYTCWIDCDLPEVVALRRKYFRESERYHMRELDAAVPEQVRTLPDRDCAVVVLEGLSMYLTNAELRGFLQTLEDKYARLHILLDVYTVLGARASRFKNPINEVGVTQVCGVDDMERLLSGLRLRLKAEHSFTPGALIDELRPADRRVFRLLFTGSAYGKLYRLFELEA